MIPEFATLDVRPGQEMEFESAFREASAKTKLSSPDRIRG